MVARPRTRRSRLASWSWRLALLAVPVAIGAALAHRLDRIETPTLYMVLGAAFVLAVAALVAAVVSLAGIWRDGRRGFGPAMRGLLLALALLIVPAVAGWQVVTLPRLHEVSTDLVRPPAFVFNAARPASAGGDADLQRAAYPELVPRRYPVAPAKVYEEARRLVAAHGWQIIDQTVPAPGRPGRIEAVAKTLLFAFREDVAIRVEADGTGTRVDMRSASRYGAHDMGSNAERVTGFLAELDYAVSTLPPE